MRASLMPLGVPTWALRAPRSNAYSWVFQSFIDELAHAAGKDPVQFRIDLLSAQQLPPPAEGADGSTTRGRSGAQAVAERAGWDKRSSLPKGRGFGVAFQLRAPRLLLPRSPTSAVDAMNRVKVNKVWVAADIGSQIVNPSMAINQSQGAVIDGLSQLMSMRDHVRRRQGGAERTSTPASRCASGRRRRKSTCTSESRTTRRPASASRRSRRCCRRSATPIFAATGKRIRTLPLSKSGFRLA